MLLQTEGRPVRSVVYRGAWQIVLWNGCGVGGGALGLGECAQRVRHNIGTLFIAGLTTESLDVLIAGKLYMRIISRGRGGGG